jgi:type II secretory pathway component GspD/PulD (secretin)
VTTTVSLQDGDLVVVATGDSNRVWWRDSGVPLLHRIPVIGSFFGRDQNATQPVQSAVLISAHQPGEAPPWMGQLDALQQRLEER